MFEEIQKIQFAELKIRASLVGAKVEEPVAVGKKSAEGFSFRDPSEYDHLTTEEKDELTNQMLQKHRVWATGKLQ